MNKQGGITKGLNFIASHQLPSGGFTSYSSPIKDRFKHINIYRTTFFPSLILSALSDLPGEPAQVIRQDIVHFLLDQRSKQWTFNYWDRHSQQAITQAYPDDLDDTFCALGGLYTQRPALFTGKVMAAVAQILIAAEKETGGPYRTWLVNKKAAKEWQDVDAVVNANIGYFLSLQNISLPGVITLLEDFLVTSQVSPYYPDRYSLLYFIGRWYRGIKSHLVVTELLESQKHGHWPTPLHTALAMSTLLRYKTPRERLKSAYAYLQAQQAPDGSWPAQAFCLDPSLDGETHYAGSPTLTTAFCLEALQMYQQSPRAVPTALSISPRTENHYHAVVRSVRREIKALPAADLREQTEKVLRRITENDKDGQIVLLPWFVAKVAGVKVRPSILRQLAIGSLWGWMAYSTYDDFLDNEGDVRLLPSANVSLRQLVQTHASTLPDKPEFQAEVRLLMDRLDAANAWEVNNCRGVIKDDVLQIKRLPNYDDLSQLADRSIGHTIAALGTLYAVGFHTDSTNTIALRQFLYHYLIARQLNDDAHDWEQDLRLGHINAVAVLILKRWRSTGHPLSQGINLQTDMEKLRQIMWQHVITDVCDLISYHSKTAQEYLSGKDVTLDAQLLKGMLKPLEASAKQALDKRAEALEFIDALSQ